MPAIFSNTHSYFPMPYLILVCLQVSLNHLLTLQSKGSYIKKITVDTQYWKKAFYYSTARLCACPLELHTHQYIPTDIFLKRGAHLPSCSYLLTLAQYMSRYMYSAKNNLIFQEPTNEANHKLILQYSTLVWCMGCYTKDTNKNCI